MLGLSGIAIATTVASGLAFAQHALPNRPYMCSYRLALPELQALQPA